MGLPRKAGDGFGAPSRVPLPRNGTLYVLRLCYSCGMPRYIAKLADDAYVECSTIVDAPTSWIVTRTEAVRQWTTDRVARADTYGTSLYDMPAQTPDQIVAGNRAGDHEEELSAAEILEAYRIKDA